MRGDLRPVVIALVAALGANACETAYGPTAPSSNWISFDSARFTLYARPGSFCASESPALTTVLEDQYTYATGVLGVEVGGRISMFLYPDGAEMRPRLQPSSGVAFPDTNAVHAVCAPPNNANLWSLLSHEANHVIMENALGRSGTSFMNEGLATALVFEREVFMGASYAHQWTRANRARLRRLSDLVDDEKWDGSQESYRASASFLAFLIERYGATPLKQIYHARSRDMASRVQAVYGKSLEALEAEWLAAV
jgi:hypothetical protein